jgi:hypothetical protein
MHVPRDDCDLRIRAPIKTVSEMNQRSHWAGKYRRSKKQQQDIRLFLNTCRKPKLPCDVWLTRVGQRQLDDDNLQGAFKAIRDEIADWLGIDDGGSEVMWHYDQVKASKPREYAVILEFYGS